MLFMVDGTTTDAVDPAEIWPEFIARLPAKLPITVVRNKADITGETLGMSEVNGHALIRLSARTGEGVDVLRNHLKQSMGFDTNMEGGFLARRRHLQALEQAAEHLAANALYQIEVDHVSSVAFDAEAVKELFG